MNGAPWGSYLSIDERTAEIALSRGAKAAAREYNSGFSPFHDSDYCIYLD